MKESNTHFYSDLELNDIPISELMGNKERFYHLPEDWHVLVADIRNSTAAVTEGKHNEVNLVATGCVIAVLNEADKHGITIPFFFGGDGATFLIPEELLSSSITVLEKHHQNSLRNFNFHITMGSFPVNEIYKEDVELKIARAKINQNLTIPVILGNGVHFAEGLIKKELRERKVEMNQAVLNLTGMECKWDKVKPPKGNQEVISLIISGISDKDFSEVYARIMAKIDSIYGSIMKRKPISVEKLKIKASLDRINAELRAKLGKWNLVAFVKSWFIAHFGEIYLKNTSAGKTYLKKLVELSDNLSLDGRINTVISGNKKQRKKLIKFLDRLEKDHLIKYGYHVSNESIMSCYVKDMSTNHHIHFVDGGNGGYTKAANMLKSKLEN